MELISRRWLVLAALTSSLIAAPGSAFAHGEMLSQVPAAGSTVKKPVDHIRINFTEEPSEDVTIEVMDGCGKNLVDEVFAEDHTLHVFLTDKGQRGRLDVRYRVVSTEDGHVTSGKYSFDVKGEPDCTEPDEPDDPAGSTPSPGTVDNADSTDNASTSSSGGSSLPLVAFIIGAAALGGIALLVRMRA